MIYLILSNTKLDILLETIDRLRDNGHEEQAADLEWDLACAFLCYVFEGEI